MSNIETMKVAAYALGYRVGMGFDSATPADFRAIQEHGLQGEYNKGMAQSALDATVESIGPPVRHEREKPKSNFGFPAKGLEWRKTRGRK